MITLSPSIFTISTRLLVSLSSSFRLRSPLSSHLSALGCWGVSCCLQHQLSSYRLLLRLSDPTNYPRTPLLCIIAKMVKKRAACCPGDNGKPELAEEVYDNHQYEILCAHRGCVPVILPRKSPFIPNIPGPGGFCRDSYPCPNKEKKKKCGKIERAYECRVCFHGLRVGQYPALAYGQLPQETIDTHKATVLERSDVRTFNELACRLDYPTKSIAPGLRTRAPAALATPLRENVTPSGPAGGPAQDVTIISDDDSGSGLALIEALRRIHLTSLMRTRASRLYKLHSQRYLPHRPQCPINQHPRLLSRTRK
jgi:hypothetical protein